MYAGAPPHNVLAAAFISRWNIEEDADELQKLKDRSSVIISQDIPGASRFC